MATTTKTAIVTGSTSGIGKAIAERLASGGANIVLNGFGDADEIERQRAELAHIHGVEVTFDGADLARPEAVDALADKALAKFGVIDIFVNNAGIQFVAPVDEFPVENGTQFSRSTCHPAFISSGARCRA